MIRYIVKNYTSFGPYAITATTGRAAVRVNGVTIHHWAGIGRGNKTAQEYYASIKRRVDVKSRWESVKCLIIVCYCS